MKVMEVNCSTGVQKIRDGTKRERDDRIKGWKAGQLRLVEQHRQTRNGRLVASDWTQLPDAPLTEARRVAWLEYRTALRDMTFGKDPEAITFPVSPEEAT